MATGPDLQKPLSGNRVDIHTESGGDVVNAREMIPERWTGAIVPGAAVCREVINERLNQVEKWGEQNHPDGTSVGFSAWRNKARNECDEKHRAGNGSWLDILFEEVYEAAAEEDPARLREELIQVAAVAVAWAEAIDRRNA
jgi:hypothetical protein